MLLAECDPVLVDRPHMFPASLRNVVLIIDLIQCVSGKILQLVLRSADSAFTSMMTAGSPRLLGVSEISNLPSSAFPFDTSA